MKEKHILGSYRYTVVFTLSVLSTTLFFMYFDDQNKDVTHLVARLGVAFVVSYFIFIVLTEEIFIVYYLAFLASALLCYPIFLVLRFAFFEGKNSSIAALISGLLFLVFGVGFRDMLQSSSWIGDMCPKCEERGGLTYHLIDSTFQGKEYGALYNKSVNTGIVTRDVYNVYMRRYKAECSKCGHTWEYNTRERELSARDV